MQSFEFMKLKDSITNSLVYLKYALVCDQVFNFWERLRLKTSFFQTSF